MWKRTLNNIFGICLLVSITQACAQDTSLRDNHSSIIDRINGLVTAHYVFPDVGERMSDHLTQQLISGSLDSISDNQTLAEQLTRELQSVSHDKHLRVSVKKQQQATSGRTGSRNNGGFAASRIIEGNIGYIDIRGFHAVSDGSPEADRIMKSMEGVDALIIDLRKNGGGSPEMVQYLCSYFFDEQIHLNSLYWRRGDYLQEFWTLDEVNGNKRPDLPLYLLTSNYTFSGAEEFCYNMQTRDRALLVGEVTGGGANPGEIMTVNSELEIFIPTGSAINPVTGTNWEGTGVSPDVEIASERALDKAIELILADK